jgi:predicted small lipoprotein YifL
MKNKNIKLMLCAISAVYFLSACGYKGPLILAPSTEKAKTEQQQTKPTKKQQNE